MTDDKKTNPIITAILKQKSYTLEDIGYDKKEVSKWQRSDDLKANINKWKSFFVLDEDEKVTKTISLPEGEITIKAGKPYLVGRLEECDINLGGPGCSLSRFHLLMILTHDILYIFDLDSFNGTYVNSDKIYPHNDKSKRVYDIIKIPAEKRVSLKNIDIEGGYHTINIVIE